MGRGGGGEGEPKGLEFRVGIDARGIWRCIGRHEVVMAVEKSMEHDMDIFI